MTQDYLFFKCFVDIKRYFDKYDISCYPTTLGKWKTISQREALACICFVFDSKPYYIYFNGAYKADTKLWMFSSLSCYDYNASKILYHQHITTMADLTTFINEIINQIGVNIYD